MHRSSYLKVFFEHPPYAQAFITAIFISQFFIEGSRHRQSGTILASEGALVRGVPENITTSSLLTACIFANETSRIFHPSYRLNGKPVCDEKRSLDGFFYIDSASVFGGALVSTNISGFEIIDSITTPRGPSDFVKTEVDLGPDSPAPVLVCINGSDSYDFQTSAPGTRTRIPCVSIIEQVGNRMGVVLWNALDEPLLDKSTFFIRMVSRSGSTVGIVDPPDFGELAAAIIRNWLLNSLLAQDAIAASLLIEVNNATVDRLDYKDVTEIDTVALVMLSLCLVGAVAAAACLAIMPSQNEVNSYNGLARAAWQATSGSCKGGFGKLQLLNPSNTNNEVYVWQDSIDDNSSGDDTQIGITTTQRDTNVDSNKNASTHTVDVTTDMDMDDTSSEVVSEMSA